MADKSKIDACSAYVNLAFWTKTLSYTTLMECKDVLEEGLKKPFHVRGFMDIDAQLNGIPRIVLEEGYESRCKEGGVFDDDATVFVLMNETNAKQCAASLNRLVSNKYEATLMQARTFWANIWKVQLVPEKK